MLGKMNYRIYIDESGNTGNVEINRNLNWNFGIQTRFVLGAVCVAENNLEVLKEEIERILNKELADHEIKVCCFQEVNQKKN